MKNPPQLIVGLGNPGADYAGTRHNIGWMVLDTWAERADASTAWKMLKDESHLLKLGTTWLFKPGTYMNRSGEPVRRQASYYDIPPASILVVSDDLDLPFGKLRYRPTGGSGGHHGLDSVFDVLGTTDVRRLRVGIGRPPSVMDPTDYVLSRFQPPEEEALSAILAQAVAEIEQHL